MSMNMDMDMNVNMNVNNLSEHLQSLISNDSELGSRLLSLLLVSSGNAEELIGMINSGQDVSQFKKLREPKKGKAATATATAQEEEEEEEEEEAPVNELDKIKQERRRKNTEASQRFRVRKKQRNFENLNKLHGLNVQINKLRDRIAQLNKENEFWKAKLNDINEIKSLKLLNDIKRRNMGK
ncbi:Transcriptional activator of sulfur metabolism met28 [Saccharomyces pastorianus]|uniref:Transcriptional activator of sulfur metabolism met28 n=1 Tax=Saccharomyces pastorianus TaxID=27292 RepID=A0A6C1EBD1_SACPS|nr:Transcriptional activator of sulfur metabolism met28 [Saccharomyces pastorianus]